MGASAIVMMIVAIGTVWGGLVGSAVYLVKHPVDDE